MLVDIGLMVGSYIFVRMLSLSMRKGESNVTKVFAVLSMLVTVFVCLDLFTRGLTAPSIPTL